MMGRQEFLPGTGRGTASRSDVVEGAPFSAWDALADGGPPPPSLRDGPPPRSGEEFAARAVRLAGLAGVLFGWGPDAFWGATPAELGALVRALAPEGATPPDAGLIARLQEAFPDG
jgi:hypothetical protein